MKEKLKKDKPVKIMSFYLRYWPQLILIVVLLFGQAYCDLMLPDYMSRIMSKGITTSDIALVMKLGGIMLGYSLVVTVCAVSVGYLASRVGTNASRCIREAMFKKVSAFSSAEFDKFTVSSLITRSTNDVQQIQMFSIMFIRLAMYAPILAIGGIFKAIEKSQGMSGLFWVILIAVLVVLVAIGILIAVGMPKFKKMQEIMDNLNLVARESLNGMMVVRAFNTEAHEEKRFDAVNKRLQGANLFVNRVMGALMPVINLVMNGVSIAVVWIATSMAGNADTVFNMMAFIQYAIQIIMAFLLVTMVFIMLPRASVSAKRIREVMNQKISIADKDGAVELTGVKGEVVFDNVTFKYGEGKAEESAIKNISFEAKPGEITAIIGATGSGKSSLIKLIPRMYDVDGGKITIDGVDIRDVTLKSLRDNISYVPQKNVLFKGTIEENIKYSDEKVSDEEMHSAAKISKAEDFILAKENGYGEDISQGGTNVSGGQKQRLAIARAVLKKSPIFIFDDSFSALDFKTDSELRQNLRENLSQSTMLIVAQRVGTIMNADQILVLNEGQVVGKGTHYDLLRNCEIYREIATSQLSKEELGL